MILSSMIYALTINVGRGSRHGYGYDWTSQDPYLRNVTFSFIVYEKRFQSVLVIWVHHPLLRRCQDRRGPRMDGLSPSASQQGRGERPLEYTCMEGIWPSYKCFRRSQGRSVPINLFHSLPVHHSLDMIQNVKN